MIAVSDISGAARVVAMFESRDHAAEWVATHAGSYLLEDVGHVGPAQELEKRVVLLEAEVEELEKRSGEVEEEYLGELNEKDAEIDDLQERNTKLQNKLRELKTGGAS